MTLDPGAGRVRAKWRTITGLVRDMERGRVCAVGPDPECFERAAVAVGVRRDRKGRTHEVGLCRAHADELAADPSAVTVKRPWVIDDTPRQLDDDEILNGPLGGAET